ncbi:MAG: HAD family hydrolase [Anaerolineales bacterium]
MKKIKAILFDLDGTLRHHLPNGGEVFLQYLESLNIQYSLEDKLRAERWEHFYFANSTQIQEDNKTFKDDINAFWVNFSRRRLIALGLSEAQAAELAPNLSKHMSEQYKPQVIVPDEIPSALTRLKEANYILGVVSNREDPFQKELDEMNLTPYFDFLLAAGEVGSFKPDTKIFHHALKMANAKADEAMYIGDNYFADIVGSHQAGLVPVLYDPTNLFPDAPNCHTIQSFNQVDELLK